jgi:hypothetical protein
MLSLWMPVRVAEEIDRKRGQLSKNEFIMAMVEAGLRDEEKVRIASVHQSGTQVPAKSPRLASRNAPATQGGADTSNE